MTDERAGKWAADQTRAGLQSGHKRHTIVVREEWVALVDEIAARFNLPKLDVWRFLLHEGIQAYREGAQPQMTQESRILNRVVDSDGKE